ncbi:hypothetical protein RRSWK_01991 [Rhodopirellula sp. SWK7]|nr:hypothetical protein RRSWK_01991 [Rhodopirellula sp. SWK7]
MPSRSIPAAGGEVCGEECRVRNSAGELVCQRIGLPAKWAGKTSHGEGPKTGPAEFGLNTVWKKVRGETLLFARPVLQRGRCGRERLSFF